MTPRDAILHALSPDTTIRAEVCLNADDEPAFLTLAERHRIRPQLTFLLKDATLSDTVLAELASVQQQSTAANLRLLAAQAEITTRLADVGIETIPFKGPLLADRLTGSASLRECYDIDLLVRPDDVDSATVVLTELGFALEDEPTPGHESRWREYRYEQAFHRQADDVRVELHWHVMPAFFPFSLNVDDLLTQAVPVDRCGIRHQALPDEVLLVLLCAHATRHCWSELCWLLDVVLLMQHELDWSRTCAIAEAAGARRMLALGVLLGGSIPGVTSLHSFAGDQTCLCEHVAAIRDGWFAEPVADTDRAYGFFADCRERSYDRLSMYWRLIFQPTQADLNWLDLPGSLEWLYPWLRPVRLAAERLSKRKDS